MFTGDFDYHLPPERIAQVPAQRRDESRLMVLRYKSKTITHCRFHDITSLLTPEYLLIINNTRVFPARLYAAKPTGGKVEILLLEPTAERNKWIAMVRPSARVAVGTSVRIDGSLLDVVIGDRTDQGQRIIAFNESVDPIRVAEQYGHMPLPPYIKRSESDTAYDELDMERYQTIFAKQNGSVAAPTASLHFTPEIMDHFARTQIQTAEITLHVGPGTFLPVKADRLEDHHMHSERFSIDVDAANLVNTAVDTGKKILSVGTTVTRTIESAADESGHIAPQTGQTDLFIYPDYRFRTVKNMLTNFHLPKSTLLMLVCALAGKDFVMDAYREAIREQYRFYSYGDAMLLLDE